MRGTAQNPDVFFQSREAANPFYDATPGIVQKTMDRFAKLTGRAYKIYEYHGAPDAERVVVAMGSGAETLHATVDALNATGDKVGVLKVRLYRPFDAALFCAALPRTVKRSPSSTAPKSPEARASRCSSTPSPRSSAAHARTCRSDRRHLRALLQGIHARDGQGRLR